jgi:hypothetical protein
LPKGKEMQMNRSLLRINILFAFFMLVSCSYPAELLLYNNTGTIITVVSEGKSFVIPRESSETIPFPANTKELLISGKEAEWLYRIEYPPREYYQYVAHPKIKAQIEPDGSIYLAFPLSEFPLSRFPAQPVGFPLSPE